MYILLSFISVQLNYTYLFHLGRETLSSFMINKLAITQKYLLCICMRWEGEILMTWWLICCVTKAYRYDSATWMVLTTGKTNILYTAVKQFSPIISKPSFSTTLEQECFWERARAFEIVIFFFHSSHSWEFLCIYMTGSVSFEYCHILWWLNKSEHVVNVELSFFFTCRWSLHSQED